MCFGLFVAVVSPLFSIIVFLLGVGVFIFGAATRNATLGEGIRMEGDRAGPEYIDHLRGIYATPPPGWSIWPEADIEETHLGVLAVLGVNRYTLHKRPAVGMGAEMWHFPPNGWTDGTSTVGAHTSFYTLGASAFTVNSSHVRKGTNDRQTHLNNVVNANQNYVRHLGIHTLNGRYAIPPLRVTPENAGLKTLATVTRADYDSPSTDINSRFTFSLGTADHPALEPQLIQLIADNADRGYTYHIEGDLLIIISSRANTDPYHLAEHLTAIAATIPAYLYR